LAKVARAVKSEGLPRLASKILGRMPVRARMRSAASRSCSNGSARRMRGNGSTLQTAAAEGSEEDRRRWPAQKRVLGVALDVMRRAGARLKPVTMPDFPVRSIYALLNAEAGAAFDDMIRAGKVNELAGKGANDRANQLRISRLIPAVEYIRAQRARTLLGRQMEALMKDCDVFLAPSTSQSVTTTNLTGHPAVTVNAGLADGLPVGLMVTGRLYDEATLLGVAAAYERARGPMPDRPRLGRATTSGAMEEQR